MRVAFRESFLKDLRTIKDQSVRRRIGEVINHVELADKPTDISNIKQLKGQGQYFRLESANTESD